MDIESSGPNRMKRLDDFTIQLDDEDVDNGGLAHISLVGKVLSDKSLNRGAVKNILGKAWGDQMGVKASDLGMNLFLFTFQRKEDMEDVLRKGPWYVMNKLVSLQYWTTQAIMKEIDFSRVQFWVQVHDLPLENLNVRCAEKILQHMGEVVEMEDPVEEGVFIRNFIRARVILNVQNPLSTGCWIPRKNLPKIWVSFKYEKLQDLCFNCGIIGHEQRFCKAAKEMSRVDKKMARYGQKQSVPPAKELNIIREEKERWSQKSRAEEQANNNTSRAEGGVGDIESEQGALIIRMQGENEQGNMPGGRDERGEDGNNRNREGNHIDDEEEDKLPDGWYPVSPESSPSPTLRMLKGTCSDSPYVHLPYSNLRLHKEYPGFIFDAGERRFGEFPWRTSAMEAEAKLQVEVGGRCTELMGELTSDTNLLCRERGREEAVECERGERRKGKATQQRRERSDYFLMDGSLAEIKGECSKGSKEQRVESQKNIDGSLAAGSRRDLMAHSSELEKRRNSGVAEEYSWEKEQKNNIEVYAKIQEDLLHLRQEVKEYYEGKSTGEAQPKQCGPEGNPLPATRVDLEHRQPRPGLGPEILEDLGLVPEFIGLKDVVILEDYPSPPDRYFSLQLNQEEIRRCKEKCKVPFKNDNRYKVVFKKKGKKKTGRPERAMEKKGYWVEFPLEKGEENDRADVKLQEDEEQSLISGMGKALILKRVRDNSLAAECVDEREKGSPSKRLRREQVMEAMEMDQGGQNGDDLCDLMAEEAGLYTPPTSP